MADLPVASEFWFEDDVEGGHVVVFRFSAVSGDECVKLVKLLVRGEDVKEGGGGRYG